MDTREPSEALLAYLQQHHEEIAQPYEAAIHAVLARLTAWQDALRIQKQRECICVIHSRIKSDASILEKLTRKGLPVDPQSVRSGLYDIAGIRVVCKFIDDVYTLAEKLRAQDDLSVMEIKDYIRHPKPNGYRSYHMVVEVPVCLEQVMQPVKVEIQIRTVAMDFWASLEHDIKYKKDSCECADIVEELKACADTIAAADQHMMDLRDRVLSKHLQYQQNGW